MRKILVPIDFSVPSSWGFYYAYDLAAAIDAELIVMHMYLPHTDSTLLEDLKSPSKEEVTRRKAEIVEHLKAATQRPLGEASADINITYLVDYGGKNEISHYAKLHQADLVVMGTRGAGNTAKKVLGSNTIKVIDDATCPVLAVPEGAVFTQNMNIAYATNLNAKDIEAIAVLAKIIEATESKLYCIHVNPFCGGIATAAEQEFEALLKKEITNVPVIFANWSSIQIEDGLDIFCRVNNIDMLAIMKQNKTTWNKLFGEKSITKAMALRNTLPLIAFHE